MSEEKSASRFSLTDLRARLLRYYIGFTRLIFSFIVLLALFEVISSFNTNQLSFDEFTVPGSMAERGYTGKEIAGRISDQIVRIRNSIQSYIKLYKTVDTSADEEIPEFDVPGAVLSLNSITGYLRDFFGRPVQRVYGSIVETQLDNASQLLMTVRISSLPSKTFTADHNSKEATEQLINLAAEHVLMHLEPFSLALYFRERDDIDSLNRMLDELSSSARNEQDKITVHIITSMIFTLQKNYPAAEKSAAKAVQLDPKHTYALHNYSLTLYDTGKLEESLRQMEKLVVINPNWASFNNMAYVLMDLGRYEEAIVRVNRSLRIYPECEQCFDTWAQILEKQAEVAKAENRPDEAEQHERLAIEKTLAAMDCSLPSKLDYYFDFLARLYLKLNDTEAAIHSYQQLLNNAPQSQYADHARQKLTELQIAVKPATQP